MIDGEQKKTRFSPEVMEKVAALELRARMTVEGLLAGLHGSSSTGLNVEFLEHRQYYPGDDLRHVDWKVYARSGRHVIKQYEEETNLNAYLIIDASASMDFGSESEHGSKFEYVGLLAAALAYLFLKQGDAVGLALAGAGGTRFVEPGSTRKHLYRILGEIADAAPSGEADLGSVVKGMGETLKRKSVVMIFSDLLEEPGVLREQLKNIRGRGGEVAVFHVLADKERDFPFTRASRFIDPETGRETVADPQAVKRQYLKKLDEFIDAYISLCGRINVDFISARTSTSPEATLLKYLQRRSRSVR